MTRLLVEKARPSTLPKKVVYILVQSRTSPRIVRWAFLLFVFTIPFESIDLGAIGAVASLSRLAGLLFFSTCLLYPKACFRRPPQALWWFVGYAAVIGLRSLFIPEKFVDLFIVRCLTIIQLLVLCWIGSRLLQEENLARSTLLVFSIATLLAAAGMLVGLPGFAKEAKGRLTVDGFNADGFALLMALGAHALIGLGFGIEQTFRNIRMRVVCLAMTLVPLTAMVYTGTRGGIVAFLAGGVPYVLPYCGSKRKMAAILGATIAIICVVSLLVSNKNTLARFEKSYETGDSSGRDIYYAIAIELISAKPLLGWGPIAFGYELGPRVSAATRGKHKQSIDPHNIILYVLAEGGLLGTLPFLLGLVFCLRAAWTARVGSLGLFPLAWLVTMLVNCMLISPLLYKTLWLVLMISLASEASTVKQHKRKNLMTRTILQHSQR